MSRRLSRQLRVGEDWQKWTYNVLTCKDGEFVSTFAPTSIEHGDLTIGQYKSEKCPDYASLDVRKIRRTPVFFGDFETFNRESTSYDAPSKYFSSDWSLISSYEAGWDGSTLSVWKEYEYLFSGGTGYEPLPKRLLDGNSRVDAMYAKILRAELPAHVKESRSIQQLASDSIQAIENMKESFNRAFLTQEGREGLAKQLGIPLDVYKKDYPYSLQTVYDILNDEGKLIQDFFVALWQSVGRQIADAIVRTVKSAVKSATDAAMDLASCVPILQLFVKIVEIAYDDWKSREAQRDKERQAECGANLKVLKDLTQSLNEAKLPYPWHLEECRFGEGLQNCQDNDGTTNELFFAETLAAMTTVREWHSWLSALPAIYKAPVQAWWQLVQAVGSVELVQNTLKTMCRGMCNETARATIGGPTPPPSDEQVMVVGVPIAVAYNYDPVEFCKALWERSAGFIEAFGVKGRQSIQKPVLHFKSTNLYRIKKSIRQEEYETSILSSRREGFTGKYETIVDWTVVGGFYGNLAVLCKDAIALAEMWKAKKLVFSLSPVANFTESRIEALKYRKEVNTPRKSSFISRITNVSLTPKQAIGITAIGSGVLIAAGILPFVTVPVLVASMAILGAKGVTPKDIEKTTVPSIESVASKTLKTSTDKFELVKR